MKTSTITLFGTILIAGVFVYIAFHEATHLVLADEAEGVCIGKCYANSPKYPGLKYGAAVAHGKHNDLSLEEDLPKVVGGTTAITFMLLNVVALGKRGQGK